MTRFAAIQMCSTADVAANNAAIETLVREAAGQGACVIRSNFGSSPVFSKIIVF